MHYRDSHDKAYFLLHFRPIHAHAALTGRLAGAENGLFWYLVFVERDQRARTGSQQSAAERQREKWGAVCQKNVKSFLLTFSTVTSSLFFRDRVQNLSSIEGKQAGTWRCPSVLYKLTHAQQPLKAEAHALQSHAFVSVPAAGVWTAFQWLHCKWKQKDVCLLYFTIWAVIRACLWWQNKSSVTPENQNITNDSILQPGIFEHTNINI